MAEATTAVETNKPDAGNHHGPTARKDMTMAQWTLHRMKVNKIGYIFVAPFFILFLIFVAYPVLLSLILSFTSFNMLQFPKFLFLDNYIRLFVDDDLFIQAFQNTLIFAAVTGPVSYLASLLLAWFINELSPRMRTILTVLLYAPSLSGMMYVIWMYFFSSDQYGIVNSFLLYYHFINAAINFFADKKYAVQLIIVVALWTSLGTSFLALIAGFKAMDRTLYEAGSVDGIRNRWQELWYITLPQMRNQLMFSAVLAITQSFGFGAVVQALTAWPNNIPQTETIQLLLQDYSWVRMELGYGSAIATVLFIMMFGSNLIINRLLRKVGT